MMIRSFLPLLLLAVLTVSCTRAPYAAPEQTRGPQHEGAEPEPEPEPQPQPEPQPTIYCFNDAGCGQASFCDMSECHMPPCPEGMACAQVCHGICAAKAELPPSVQIGNPVGPVAPDTTSTALSITGDTLTISVTYSGGCEKHDFELFWAGSFLESSPVQVALVLTHDAHGDACKALITESVSFDLTPLKAAYQSGYKQAAGTISIRVGSLSIAYTFG